jgi:hypothetical protein
MEDRVIIALAIAIAMALVAAGLITRKLVERERFKQRQMGRGKGSQKSSLEPTE